jgi:hypothetical protein
MKRQLDMDKIVRGLGAERRGKVSATGSISARCGRRSQVPRTGGRRIDPRWTERRLVPLAPETLERLEEITSRVREHGESTSNRCSLRRCCSRKRPGNSARLKPRSSSGRADERVVIEQRASRTRPHLPVDARSRGPSICMLTPGCHPDRDACIHGWMPGILRQMPTLPSNSSSPNLRTRQVAQPSC